jgi:serine/threonine-protein kinase
MPRDPLIGARLGVYVLRQLIGEGGMSVVYRAEQPEIAKSVAIKILRMDAASQAEHLERLREEARTVNAIHHRGIIDVFGFGTTSDGRPYIVMEYLEGQPLHEVLRQRQKLDPQEALEILDEVLSAVGAAHQAGVVHRDLKPANIFVARDWSGRRYVKVLDFGLAKKTERPYGSVEQTDYRPAGTPEYMAPEQARGERVGPRSDLYSLGIIAFELLSGQVPFQAASLMDLLLKHLQEPPPTLSALEPSVPPDLEQLIRELLAKNPPDRPQSAEEVHLRMQRILEDWRDAQTQTGHNARTIPALPEQIQEMLERAVGPHPDAAPNAASLKTRAEKLLLSAQGVRKRGLRLLLRRLAEADGTLPVEERRGLGKQLDEYEKTES